VCGWVWSGLSLPAHTHTHTHTVPESSPESSDDRASSSLRQFGFSFIMTRVALNISVAFILLLSRYCDANRKLMVFLIDGFRYDYMDDLQNLSGFREIVENGVKVDYLTPDFPSLSYPNYYSLMTGGPYQLFIYLFICFCFLQQNAIINSH